MGTQARDVTLADADRALARIFQAGDHAEGGRLAAPRGSEEGEEGPTRDRQAEVIDRDHVAESLREVRESEVVDVTTGARHQLPIAFWKARWYLTSCSSVSVMKT